jgi:hypothetical protein
MEKEDVKSYKIEPDRNSLIVDNDILQKQNDLLYKINRDLILRNEQLVEKINMINQSQISRQMYGIADF